MLIKSGYFTLLFCFDVADEILLDKIEKILGKRPAEAFLELKRITPEFIQYRVPPLRVKLGKRTINIDGKNYVFSYDAKIYDFGAIALRYWVPINGLKIKDLQNLAASLSYNKKILADAKQQIAKLVKELESAIIGKVSNGEYDEYSLFYITELEKPINAEELIKLHGIQIANALSCEAKALSKEEIESALKKPISYYPNDLILIDANAAFILEPEKSYDALDVIEYSLLELLELRTYDEKLDKFLDQTYDRVKEIKPSLWIIPKLNKILKDLLRFKIEVIDVIDKVENSLKLFGDAYLVKIYSLSAEINQIASWKESVKSKLNTIVDIYSILSSKMDAQRDYFLEMAIVLLFILDIFIFVFLVK